MRILAENVSKWYGSVRALDNVSLTIESGMITGVLGPNGAGKTTLLRALSGSLRVSSGRILLGDIDVVRDPQFARSIVGFVAETHMLFPDLTVWDNLMFVARLFNLEPGDAGDRIRELAGEFEIPGLLHRRYGSLSKGQKRRVDIISALLHNPPILFLDEPTSGLDPLSAMWLRGKIRELARSGVTIVISTHYIAEAFDVSDKIIVLANGRIIAEGPPDRLRRMVSGREVEVVAQLSLNPEVIVEELRGKGYRASTSSGEIMVVGPSGPVVEDLVRIVNMKGGRITSLIVKELSWEEVFSRLIRVDEGREGCPCKCGG